MAIVSHNGVDGKDCSRCAQWKPLSEFNHRKRNKDGFRSECRDCQKSDNQRYYTENYEVRYEANRQYLTRNLEKERARKRQWQESNREQQRVANRRWSAQNPAKNAAKRRNRTARLRAAEGTHTVADIEAQYKRQKGRCYYCGCELNGKYHVDHVVPITRGGRNSPDNLVIACDICNESKQNKLPHEWPAGGRLL